MNLDFSWHGLLWFFIKNLVIGVFTLDKHRVLESYYLIRLHVTYKYYRVK